jgi:septum formation protein
VLDNNILGKPKTVKKAEEMLKSLSGRKHRVITGVCIWDKKSGKKKISSAVTEVYFKKLSFQEICDYIKTGEPLDKAGAYGIQGRGATLVEKINGDYFNVVGLPLCKLFRMLKSFGIK